MVINGKYPTGFLKYFLTLKKWNDIWNDNSFLGDVAVKMLNVTAPTPQQLQAFKNEVGVLR